MGRFRSCRPYGPEERHRKRCLGELDLVVARARVVDGTGAPWFRADVGVAGDRIAAVGDLADASAPRRLDADDLVLAPGFVDAHVHSETALLRDPLHEAGLRQGVTTHIVGQDGFGLAPASQDVLDFTFDYLGAILGPRIDFEPGGISDFLDRYDGASTVNVATLIPNGNVRMLVRGNAEGAASPEELEAMAERCRAGMREGAVGLSSGLDYVPSGFASTDELARLAAAVAPDGVYVTHVRYELGLLDAVREAIEIGRRGGVPVHISHLRADVDAGVWADEILGLLDGARADGVDVTFDVYPYLFGCTILGFLLPLWVWQGSSEDAAARLRDAAARERMRRDLAGKIDSWRRIAIAGELAPEREHLLGRDVLTAAGNADPVDFLCDLLLAEDLDVVLLGIAPDDPRAPRDLGRMLADALHMTGSDGIYRTGRIHPRAYGAFARLLGRFVREEGLLTLEEAVRHATSQPARRHGLLDRGLVRPGFAADLVVLDPAALIDRSTLADPAVPAEGIRHVLLNGVPVLLDGEPTGETPGRGLRRTGAQVPAATTAS